MPVRSESMMSRSKSYPVALSAADRGMLVRLVRTGSAPAQQVRRARILLALDENDPGREGPVPTQELVAQRAGVHVDTVVKTSKADAERGGEDQPQEAAHPAGAAEGDRRGRGEVDRTGLLEAAAGASALVAAAGREAGRGDR